ncbi:MAG TPA: anthranilate synthase component I family protein [Candidatus Thermoplasmatota archaeon]|nr:anthranilate synthase component I family protein [Candidatus Thermoplasmatota archaeon]
MLERRLDLSLTPTALFARLYEAYHTAFLLESAEGPERLARYSILGFDPVGEVAGNRGNLRATGNLPAQPEGDTGSLRYLQRLLGASRARAAPGRYAGGLVGYLGYEYIDEIEDLPARKGQSPFPDVQFGLFEDGIVYDRVTGHVTYFSHGADRSRDLLAVAEEEPPSHAVRFGEPRRNVGESGFVKMVEEAKEHILAGDIFQVVLSKRIDVPYEGNLFGYYEALKRANPSPYMYFLKFGHRTIVGASPEMLARVENGRVETFPIAGTRPLGRTPAETDHLAQEMLKDPKERAEHAMLVDLARNDLGRVSRYGSVQVSEYAKVERYSHVQHLVSRVEGQLAEQATSFDALRSVFPAGTLSGAPKVEALKIIRRLEPDPRGPYGGCVGYFSFNGNMDAAITIRTLTAVAGTASVQTGAGIVHDSDPVKEYEETEAKARGLLSVMERFP